MVVVFPYPAPQLYTAKSLNLINGEAEAEFASYFSGAALAAAATEQAPISDYISSAETAGEYLVSDIFLFAGNGTELVPPGAFKMRYSPNQLSRVGVSAKTLSLICAISGTLKQISGSSSDGDSISAVLNSMPEACGVFSTVKPNIPDMAPPESMIQYGGLVYPGQNGETYIGPYANIGIYSYDSAQEGVPASGLKNIYYGANVSTTSLAGAAAGDFSDFIVYMSTFNLLEGTSTVTYFALDNAGNIELPKQVVISADYSSPETVVVPNENQFMAEGILYTGGSSGIILHSEDLGYNGAASGVASIMARVDAGREECQLLDNCPDYVYRSPVVVAGGAHVLHYWAEDRVGNLENEVIQDVFVDTVAPRTAMYVDGVAVSTGAVVSAKAADTITITAVDQASDVKDIFLLIDVSSDSCQEDPTFVGPVGTCENPRYISPFTLSVGPHTVYYTAFDNVGNQSAVKMAVINVAAATQPSPAAGEWRFDEASGSVAHDISTNASHGNIVGATWTEGVAGGALNFDGVNDYVEIPNIAPYQGMSALTVEMWAYAEQVDMFAVLMHKSQAYVKGDYELQIGPQTGDKRINFIVANEGNQESMAASDVPMEPGKWVHIVGVYNGAEVSLYIDGVKQSRTGALTGKIANSGVPLWIGGGAGYSIFWNGKIDNTTIYDRALSAQEIAARYSGGQASPVTSSSADGLMTVTTPGVELEVSSVSTGTITSTMTVFTAMAAAGLEPVLGNFYELEPSGVQFASSATFRFAFNPVGVDTNTVAIYYFDGVTWSSASIYGQRIVMVSGTEAYVEGEILHTSLYALLRKTPARPAPSVKVVLSPSTLNLGSNGQTVTAELTINGAGCFMGDTINMSAVNGAALSSPIYAVKPGAKKDGSYGVLCGSATVKFDRDAVAAALPGNTVATVTVSGTFSDGGIFAAPAVLRTIKNAKNVKVSEYGLSSASDQVFKLGEVYVYPDPAKGGKVPTFHIEVGTADSVKIRVYTVAGQLAHERMLTGNPQAIGGGYAYEYAWEGHIASGVYYYTIEAERSGKKIRTKGKFSVVR